MAESKKKKFDLEKIYKDIDEAVASRQEELNRIADEAYAKGYKETTGRDFFEDYPPETDEKADK